MYQIKVNDKFNFEVEANQNQLTVNKEAVQIDRLERDGNNSHVIFNHKSYAIEVVSFDVAAKTAVIKVNGNTYNLAIKDQFDQLLKQLGMENLAVNKILQLKAPMPGLVLNVLVAEGDEIKKGDNLLVLEAMKMENIIKSPTDGIIKKIEVKQGDKVEKNEMLISFD